MAKTEEDWFLRGGKRPDAAGAHGDPDARDGEPPEDDPGNKVCQNCGGENLAEETECTHCGASLTGGCPTGEYCGADDGDVEKTYIVTVVRTKTVDQYIELRVTAKDEDEAEDIAVRAAETQADANWVDDEDTVDYCDCGVEDAEEVDG